MVVAGTLHRSVSTPTPSITTCSIFIEHLGRLLRLPNTRLSMSHKTVIGANLIKPPLIDPTASEAQLLALLVIVLLCGSVHA